MQWQINRKILEEAAVCVVTFPSWNCRQHVSLQHWYQPFKLLGVTIRRLSWQT